MRMMVLVVIKMVKTEEEMRGRMLLGMILLEVSVTASG